MAYNGRRGPNVSEYIANLNAIPSAQDIENSQGDFDLDEDLAMFTNTQFFDSDLNQFADLQPTDFGDGQAHASIAGEGSDLKSMDFDLQGDFTFPDFGNFTAPSTFGADPAAIQTTIPPYTDDSSPTAGPSPSISGEHKRKASSSAAPDFEEASRHAAEEDKRRRNTAASARFRVKKKQREAALERSAKDMNDKVAALEGRINQLETENKWLKNLITEKNESNEDIAALWKKYNRENAERKGSERKDGVGTKA
ncbi:Regulatory protein [Lachnellula occidentalis]|uniref:Regulatory protein n=1 Tax=Lachnellula occidentalis TaxID=215460 RepID=A0A8H8UH42_9HELO|nr:Regulatory protein [Lachnellula occidentalis]